MPPVNAAFTDERQGFANRLDDAGYQEVAAQLNEIGGLRRFGNVEGSLADRVEEISRSSDSIGLAGGDDLEFACSSHIWTSEDWRGDEALAGTGMINRKSLR